MVSLNYLIIYTKVPNLYYYVLNSQCFKDTRGIFTKIWTMVVNYTLQCIVAVKNYVYGWSNEIQ